MWFAHITPNGLRYPLVGGTRERSFDGINSKSHKLPENAQTPTSRVHAVLGASQLIGSSCFPRPSNRYADSNPTAYIPELSAITPARSEIANTD